MLNEKIGQIRKGIEQYKNSKKLFENLEKMK